MTATKDIVLIPDAAILMEARIASGNHRSLKIRDVANLIMHDPVLSAEVLQAANSTMYSGAPVADLEAALTRMGSAQISLLLNQLSERRFSLEDDVIELFEILRFKSRRTSIVSLIIAAAVKPTITLQARMAGLMSETGHMIALLKLGKVYCELAKGNAKKNLPFRLEKDHKINLDTVRTQFLKAKGMPSKILVPYDLDMEIKSSTDVDIRACVRSAIEMIEAFDNGKFSNYNPDKPLPAQSSLRLLKVSLLQMEKLYKTISDYLKKVSVEEEPEGAAVFLQSSQEERTLDLNEGSQDNLKVPNFPTAHLKPQSQEKLKFFSDIFSKDLSVEEIKLQALDFLVDNGFFKRVAFLKINPESDQALVIESKGFDSNFQQKIAIKDPLSPLKLFQMRIKSFNAQSSKPNAPFGVSAYAIGPVSSTPEGDRLILYADREGATGLTLDLRGVFRLAMSLLSTKIQSAGNS